MARKIIGSILCAVLLFSVCVSADDMAVSEEQMPFTQGERPGRRPEMPEGFDPSQMPNRQGEMAAPQAPMGEPGGETVTPPSGDIQADPAPEEGVPENQPFGEMQRPDIGQGPVQETERQPTDLATESASVDYLTLGISLGLLAAAFVFVIFYKRRRY